jgi:hypothetical protein
MMKKLVVIRMAEKKNAFNCPGAPYHSIFTQRVKVAIQGCHRTLIAYFRDLFEDPSSN